MKSSNHKYAVVLTAKTREHLESITRNGHVPAKKILRWWPSAALRSRKDAVVGP
jgi:hypothetical protein